ncbi:MAG: hypothetical protein KDD15_11300 [Lewinella sp.]|nr:hypothetical protein [Lewinella sp.]
MIRELVEFTEQLDVAFKQTGLRPKDGLHVVLTAVKDEDGTYRISEDVEWRTYSRKGDEMDQLLKNCAAWTKAAWMIGTNKCMDLPQKAIHSASPYCLAFKRTALEGGAAYRKIQTAITAGKQKEQLYHRVGTYFGHTWQYLPDQESDHYQLSEAFCQVLNTSEKLHQLLSHTGAWEALSDDSYIVFYLDLPLEIYRAAHNLYLQNKLFNTADFNEDDERGNTWGTSDFFNSFDSKKPFLLHRTATFQIPGRIKAHEARQLYEFGDLLNRKILPNPLPVFILQEELLEQAITIFKREALLDASVRKSYAGIIEELYDKHPEDLGNYYLLYYVKGIIRDFDFVSRFRYHLRAPDGSPWRVQQLMKFGEALSIDHVFEFQRQILPVILNNSLVRLTKKGMVVKYFEDIEPKHCDDNNVVIYGLVRKYRQAIYDFIYKSRGSGLTATAFRDIMSSGIRSDINRDKTPFHICQKLNIWFSLNGYFDPDHSNFNGINMSETIPQLMEKMRQVANDGAHFETPEAFAFGAGQVIYFLLRQSKTENKTHALLEPFTQKTNPDMLKQEIARVFDRYKQEISFGQGRFERLMREVLGYSGPADLRKLFPVLLAGYFSEPVIFEQRTNDQ